MRYGRRAVLSEYIGRRSEAIEFYDKTLELYSKYNLYSGMAATYNNLAEIYKTSGKCSKAIEMYDKSLELDKKTGNRLGSAISYNNLAEVYIFLNEIKKAQEYLDKYFDLNEKIHNTLGFGYGYLNMGIIHFRKKSFSEAINCYKKALSIFKELKSNSMIVNTYRFLSLVYLKTGDLESTEETLSKIEKYVETSESTLLKASKDWIRGKLFMTNGEYAKAEVLLLNAYGLYTRMEDIDGLLNTSYDLICLYRAIEDTGKVKHFISKAKKIIDNITKEIREQELIKSFLNREVVKKILFNTE